MIDDQVARERLAGLQMLLAIELGSHSRRRLDVTLSREVALQIEEALEYAAEALQSEVSPPAPRWARPALMP
jgi:hypothetical protein